MIIKETIEIEKYLDGYDLAQEIWDSSDITQARMINELGNILNNNPNRVLMQMNCISSMINDNGIKFVQKLHEYLCEENNEL